MSEAAPAPTAAAPGSVVASPASTDLVAPVGKDAAQSKTVQGLALLFAAYYLEHKYGIPSTAVENISNGVAQTAGQATVDAAHQLYASASSAFYDIGGVWTALGVFTRKMPITSVLGLRLDSLAKVLFAHTK